MTDGRLRWSGEGPALVLIHGWAAGPEVFRSWLPRLESRWRVGTVTLPGHGECADGVLNPAAIARFVAGRLTKPAVWLGWSLGAQVALQAARYHGSAVRAVVALSATPRFCPAHDWSWGVPRARLRAMRRGLDADVAEVVVRFADATLGVQGPLSGHGIEALRSGLECLERNDLRTLLPEIQSPLLWLAGDRDPLVSVEALRAAASLTPGAQSRVLGGAGHAPFLTHAPAIEEAIDTWTEGTGEGHE